MKNPIVTSLEMRRIEALSVKEGGSEESFMKQAGKKIALHAEEMIQDLDGTVILLLGKGNKGGDALIAGLALLEKGISVRAITLVATKDCSPLQQKFREVFTNQGGSLQEIDTNLFKDASILIDGLLGTGFQGEVVGELAALIRLANQSKKPILSIDVPSGLDGTTGEVKGDAICAARTVCLGLLKVGLFSNDGWNQVGDLYLEDFGLPEKYVEKAEILAVSPLNTTPHLPLIKRNRHKYEAGYVVGFSGSKVFKGAPKLAGLSSLRSGAGIARIFHIGDIGEVPFSLICQEWDAEAWNEELKRADSVFIGPGIGDAKQAFLKKELKGIQAPLVCDAEGVQKEFEYPPHTILTPHKGEVLRLLGLPKGTPEKELFFHAQEWVNAKGYILVVKGAPTWIFAKEKKPIVCAGGDPGMAIAGSGDVLTGIIASLLAQKVAPIDAAVLGVQLHLFAGKEAAKKKGSYSMIAEDLIDHLPQAFQMCSKI